MNLHYGDGCRRLAGMLIVAAHFVLLSQSADAVPTNGLVAYYPFYRNTLDYSGLNHHCTNSGLRFTNNQFGVAASAAYFDGNASVGAPPTNRLMFGVNPFSISCWVRLIAMSTNDQNLIAVSDAGLFGGWTLVIDAGTTNLSWIIQGIKVHSFEVSIPVGAWTHIAMVRVGDTNSLYLNGVLRTNAIVSSLDHSSPGTYYLWSARLLIGERSLASIDDVALYDRPLSSNEVTTLLWLDEDGDEDGIPNWWEIANGFNPLLGSDAIQDVDTDGLTNIQEYLQGTNPQLSDTDGDGLGDGYEVNMSHTEPLKTDSDNDGMTDGWEVTSDLNPLVGSDAGQDTDADGLTNYEEYQGGLNPRASDTDGDGLNDGYEVNTSQTDPTKTDTDGDGLSDGYEVNISDSDPTGSDTDGDGLSDGYEVNTSHTDPLSLDSDSDDMPDGWEVVNALNPLLNTDGQADSDGDGLSNLQEYQLMTNPLGSDADGDGAADGFEVTWGLSPTSSMSRPIFVDDNAVSDPVAGDPDQSDPFADGTASHPFDAIQDAIDLATNGQVISVLPGTYSGVGNRDVRLMGKSLKLVGRDGATNTLLEGNFYGGFICDSNETRNTLISGFKVHTWKDFGGKAGLRCIGASPTITNCWFTDCGEAGILATNGASPHVVDSRFDYNEGAIVAFGSAPRIERCSIATNTAGRGAGIYLSGVGATSAVLNCLIMGNMATNEGGGLYVGAGVTASIVNCTIVSNFASVRGGGLANLGVPSIRNTVFSGNSNSGIWFSAAMDIQYSCLQEFYPGTANLVTNPVFWSATDFRPAASSPLIDRGTTVGAPIDDFRRFARPVDGDTNGSALVDIGAYEFTPRSLTVTPTDMTFWIKSGASTNQIMRVGLVGDISSVTCVATSSVPWVTLSPAAYSMTTAVRDVTVQFTGLPTQAGVYTGLVATRTFQSPSSVVSTVFTVHIMADLPGSISITHPTSSVTFLETARPVITASASDGDGIASVAFYANDVFLGVTSAPPYQLIVSNFSVGTCDLRAVMTDGTGLQSSSAVVRVNINDMPWRVLHVAGLSDTQGSVDGTGAVARFNKPVGIICDSAGNAIVADGDSRTIRKITPSGVVTTIAGQPGVQGTNDGVGSAATFSTLEGLDIDSSGTIYVGDTHSVRKITPAGQVSTFVGQTLNWGYLNAGGNDARFDICSDVAIGTDGNLYIADRFNRLIRKVTPSGDVSTLAGMTGISGVVDGTGTVARFLDPRYIDAGPDGYLYVGESSSSGAVRRVSLSGVVTTVAGLGVGSVGDYDGVGRAAAFGYVHGLAMDSKQRLFVCDDDSLRVIMPDGAVSYIMSSLSLPYDLAVGPGGSIWVLNTLDDTVMRLTSREDRDDADGDGFSDYRELVAGTDWTNASDVFSIQTFALASTNATGLVIQWTSVTGHTYNIEAGTSVTGSVWTQRAGPFAGTGGLKAYTNVLGGVRKEYLRVRVTSP